MNRRIHPILLLILVIISALFGLSLHLLAEVTEKTKNEAGIVASRTARQLFSAIRRDLSGVTVPDGVIKDVAISPDNARAYTVESDGFLRAYKISSTNTHSIPSLVSDDSTPLSSITSPTSLAVTPDASLAFIAGNKRIMAINLKRMTRFDATTDSSIVYNKYMWTKTITTGAKNYTKVAVGPSGRYLYYLADFSKSVSQPFEDSTVFGEFGSYEIDMPMSVVSDSEVVSGVVSSTLDVITSSDTPIKFSWSKDLRPPDAELPDVSRGGSDSYLGPYSMAISPDEDYAMITALGRRAVGLFDPVLGRIPPPDEQSGGILMLDLQKGAVSGSHGDYLRFMPTLVDGQPRIGERLARYARRIEHPVVTTFDVLATGALAGAHALAPVGAGTAGASAINFSNRVNSIYALYKDIYSNYGILKAYQDIYSNDMVGASDIGISPKGDKGLLTLKWTNNIGILNLKPSTNVHGHSFNNTSEMENFVIEAALEKKVSSGATESFLDELLPEQVEFSVNGAVAYIGMRGGVQSHARYGLVDLVEVRQEMEIFHFLLNDSSLFVLETQDGLPSSTIDALQSIKDEKFEITLDFELALNSLGITNPILRDTIKDRALTSSSLSERGLRNNLLTLASSPGVDIIQPKNVATFISENVDGDFLSDHVEAYNRFNIALSPNTGLVNTGQSELTSTLGYNKNPFVGVLLPRAGLGYRHNELFGKNKTNVAKPSLIDLIERVGRIWHNRHIAVITPYSRHPHFILVDMSAPGWEDIGGGTGAPVHEAPRKGDVANIQYFRLDPATGNGRDDPFEFVLSNNTNLLDNSIPNPSTGTEFDTAATHALIDLLVCQPEVTQILLDPEVGYSGSDGRVVIRGLNDTDNPGSRRDTDAWMQIQVAEASVDLVAFKDQNLSAGSSPHWSEVPDHEEQVTYGSGVAHTQKNSSVMVRSSFVGDPRFTYKLFFDNTEITMDGVASDTEIDPDNFYIVDQLILPGDEHFSDILLKVFFDSGAGVSCDEPFFMDTVSLLDKLGVSPWGRYLVLQVVKSRIYSNCSPLNNSIGSMHAKQ